MTRLVALTVLAVFTPGCGKLLGITDPTPNEGSGGGDAGIDAPGPPPPACVTPVEPAEFGAEQTFTLGRAGVAIAVGRLVAGGGVDLAIAQGDRFEIMTGNGAGSFASRGFVTVPADGVLIDDFDNDADDDVVSWNSAQVVTSRQEGGGFLAAQPLTGPFSSVQVVMSGFLNGAFVPDVIVKDTSGARRFISSLGTPGTFLRDADPIANTGAGDALVAIEPIDLLEDDDVAVVAQNGDVKISLAASGDTHAAASAVAGDARDRGVAFGRFASLGTISTGLDMIVGTADGGVVYVGESTGLREVPGLIPAVTTGPIRAIDVNGDGRDDLVLPTGIVYQCTPADRVSGRLASQFEPLDLSGATLVTDITADGKPDLIRVTGTTLRVRIQ